MRRLKPIKKKRHDHSVTSSPSADVAPSRKSASKSAARTDDVKTCAEHKEQNDRSESDWSRSANQNSSPSASSPAALRRIAPKAGERAEKRRRRLKTLRESIKLSEVRNTAPSAALSAENLEFSNPAVSRKKPKPSRRVTPAEKVSESDVAGQYSVLQLVEPPPPEHESYSDWFRRVVVKNRWLTWFTTFYIHWIILLLMAAIIVHGPENAASLLINAAFAETTEPEPVSFDVVAPEPQQQQHSEPETVPLPVPTTDAPELAEREVSLSDALLNELAADQKPAATATATAAAAIAGPATSVSDDRMRYSMAPPEAVSQGSFSVWTEPSEPRAGQPYRIIIQVRLPDDLSSYNVADLEGVVVGSDGYRKPVPGSVTGSLPIHHGYARFVVPIVSADEKVCDTVFIRSRMLREAQKLVLQF